MEKTKNIKDIEIAKKRLGILITSKLRRQDKIERAVKIQDKLSDKSESWNGEKEIIKWRTII